jgi:hypothetical protein
MEKEYHNDDFYTFQSSFCKPLCLASAPEVKVAMLDVDAIWFYDPYVLTENEIFKKEGIVLFHDQKSTFADVTNFFVS